MRPGHGGPSKATPVWRVPNNTFALTEVKKDLRGVTPLNPFIELAPEDWYYSK